MSKLNRIKYNKELIPKLDDYSFLELQRGWKGISIEHVERLTSNKEVESYSKSLNLVIICKKVMSFS